MESLQFFERGEYDAGIDAVRFLAMHGSGAVAFTISRTALELLEGGAPRNSDGCVTALRTHRIRIRHTAQMAFLRKPELTHVIELTEVHVT